MNIIGHSKIFISIAAILVVASVLAIAFWGLEYGIDFTGGSLMEVTYLGERPSIDTVRNELRDLPIGEAQVQPTDEEGMILKFQAVDEELHQQVLGELK